MADDIVPIAEFKAHLSEHIRELRERARPLIRHPEWQAGGSVAHAEEFDRLTNAAQFLKAVQEGQADFDAGRVVSDEELGRRLDALFGPRKK